MPETRLNPNYTIEYIKIYIGKYTRVFNQWTLQINS